MARKRKGGPDERPPPPPSKKRKIYDRIPTLLQLWPAVCGKVPITEAHKDILTAAKALQEYKDLTEDEKVQIRREFAKGLTSAAK